MKLVNLGEKNILVVDDDLFNRKLIVKFLGKYKNLTLFEAEHGFEALRHLKENRIDLCLLDLYMPNMNGLEMLEYIRYTEEGSPLPIIIITSDDIEREKSFALGASHFISKPVRFSDLEVKIYESLKKVE